MRSQAELGNERSGSLFGIRAMPRFVVLRHECPADYVRPSHWDLMLESEGHLRTWALLHPPDLGEPITAEALDNHRLEYLDYEGPISKGPVLKGPVSKDRGSVARWDRGTYQVEYEDSHQLVVVLRGGRLVGRATLTRLPGDDPQWTFVLAAR